MRNMSGMYTVILGSYSQRVEKQCLLRLSKAVLSICMPPGELCMHCKKDYCGDCEPTMQSCSGCNQERWKKTCSGCGESCDGCGKFWCKQCPNLFRCVCCNETVCTECSPYEESFMRAIPAEEFACVGCKDGDC